MSPPRAVTFATALVRILACKVGAKVRELWPRHAQVLPPPPGRPFRASTFSPQSSLLWQQVFVFPSPLGAVESRERECGNLSPARKQCVAGTLPPQAFSVVWVWGGLRCCRGMDLVLPATLQSLPPRRDAPTLRLLRSPAPHPLVSLRIWATSPRPLPRGSLRNWLVRAFLGDTLSCCPSPHGDAGRSTEGTG